MTRHDGSRLGIPRQRFLSDVIEHALQSGRRSPADFLRHFPPATLMQALAGHADLRARILFATVGTRTPIGERKSPQAAAEDLELALEVGETDPETIVALLTADDRVRHLDERALWSFVTEGELWKATEGIELDIARAHVSYILERALAEELVGEREVIDALGIDQLARSLPRERLVRLVTAALEHGREERPFREGELMALLPVAELVEHVPLPLLWDRVVVQRIAEPRGLTGGRASAPPGGMTGDRPSTPPRGSRAARPARVPSLARTPAVFDDATEDVVRALLDAE